MYRVNLVRGLQFHHYFAAYQEIKPIATIQAHAFVLNWQGFFLFKANTLQRKFVGQTGLVSRFKQTRAKRPVHLNGCLNYLTSQLLLVKYDVPCPWCLRGF